VNKEEGKQKTQGQEKSPPEVEEGKKKVNGVELYYNAIGSSDTIIVLHEGLGLDRTEFMCPAVPKTGRAQGHSEFQK
jgi:hypothetical protein